MKIKTVLLGTVVSLASASTFAGQIVDVPVDIDLDNRLAVGNMTTARFSENEFEAIGCGVRQWAFPDGTSFSWGFCQAKVEEGANQLCTTQNPELLDTMKASSDFAFVTFRWDENDECTYVGFSTQSQYIPELKDKKDKKDK